MTLSPEQFAILCYVANGQRLYRQSPLSRDGVFMMSPGGVAMSVEAEPVLMLTEDGWLAEDDSDMSGYTCFVMTEKALDYMRGKVCDV